MPLYDLKCRRCGVVSELFLRDGNIGNARCPECDSSQVDKLLSTFNSINRGDSDPGTTCCGRDERCDRPPCYGGDGCYRS